MSDDRPPDRAGPIVLVGLMGAGKSTAGRHLARLLGREFVDLDERIARRATRSISELFAVAGEAAFRDLEVRETLEIEAAIRGSPAAVVVAAGGGWMANREARAALPGATIVWLKVAPAEAARRIGRSGAERPLLTGEDPVARLTSLLDERLPAYREATYTVDTSGLDPRTVARRIAATCIQTTEE